MRYCVQYNSENYKNVENFDCIVRLIIILEKRIEFNRLWVIMTKCGKYRRIVCNLKIIDQTIKLKKGQGTYRVEISNSLDYVHSSFLYVLLSFSDR